MDEKKTARAVEEMKNIPYWKAEAAGAATAASRRHLDLEMYYAYHNGYSAPRLSRQEILEVFSAMYELEDRFTPEDWGALARRSTGTTFPRVCRYRAELLSAGSLSYPKWRYIYRYISEKNPFRGVAKEKLDLFTSPLSFPCESAENRRMEDALYRAQRNFRWKKACDSCPGPDERRLLELCAYFAENHTLGHFIRDLISLRYDKGGKSFEYLEESGIFLLLDISTDDMFESVRF
ncbi:MAG: hypothetical protein LUD51_03260 [Clostridia bacterium]|nr:hypothetical protein [Clostridia bacterium]